MLSFNANLTDMVCWTRMQAEAGQHMGASSRGRSLSDGPAVACSSGALATAQAAPSGRSRPGAKTLMSSSRS